MSFGAHRGVRALAALATLAGTVILFVCWGTPGAVAQTDPTALVGEGGSFLTPVTNLLLNSDTASGLAPLNPEYSDDNLDNAIGDFVGTGPGDFDADFVVSERPLTSTEAATAAADGRSFAYVPFAATPVALAVFAVCTPSDLTQNTLTPTTFCNDMPLTPAQVGEILTNGLTTGSTVATVKGWNDPTLTQANGQPIPDPNGIGHAADESPSAENSAIMALMDSDTTAKADLDNALANTTNSPRTTSDTPSELWPFFPEHAYPGGDEALLEHELTIEPTTNAPSFLDSWGALSPNEGGTHDAFPLSGVWAGSPEGTPWNVPTAAIENADQKFVAPTEQAAAAAETGAGMTLDPTTNLVTFNPDSTDAAAYNNYLMVESYLVVPTTGLDPTKAVKLAQFIRYVLGSTGQSEIAVLGAAPATPAEVTAGLKVASELDAEALTSSSGSSGSSSASGQTATASTPAAASSNAAGATDPADGTTAGHRRAPTRRPRSRPPAPTRCH